MSVQDNKELIRQYYKDLNAERGDIARLRSLTDEYWSPSYTWHIPSGEKSREEAMQEWARLFSALADSSFVIEDMVAEGDRVVTRYSSQAVHKGNFMGIPATGKRAAGRGVLIDRIAQGKILEEWEFADILGMMTQLGAIPAPNEREDSSRGRRGQYGETQIRT